MPNETNPLFLLYAVIVAQFGHLLFVLLQRPTGRPLWRYCLLILAVVMSIMVAEFMLTWSGYLAAIPWVMGISFALAYLLGPIMLGCWYYRDGKPWRPLHLLHLFPFVIALLFQLPFLLLGNTVKSQIYEAEIATEAYFHQWVYIKGVGLKVAHLGIYLLIGSKYLRKKDKISRGLMITGVLFVTLWLIHALLLTFSLPGYALTYCTFIAFCGAMAIWLTSQLRGQPVIVAVDPASSTKIAPAAAPKNLVPKYEKSGVDEEMLEENAQKLEQLMTEGQVYLNPDLRLRDLAAAMALPDHHLSQLLNAKLGVKFHDYVNALRVSHAQKLLLEEPPDTTMLAIAYAAGFNSKNSFNRAFRKFTGMSPSGFRKTGVIRPDGAQE